MTLRTLLAHRARVVLGGLAVVIGVGFVAGTFVFSDTLKQSFFDSFARTSQGIDVAVLPPRGQRVPTVVVDAVAKVPGVAVAEGWTQDMTTLLDKDREPVSGQTMVTTVLGDERIRNLGLVEGRFPERPDEAVITTDGLERAEAEIGDTIELVGASGRPTPVTVVGTLDPHETSAMPGTNLVGLEPEAVINLLDASGYGIVVAVADAEISPAALVSEVRDAAASAAPGGSAAVTDLRVLTGEELQREEAEEFGLSLKFLTQGLLLFALVALIVAGFVINNTYAVLLAQRTRELALLRCVGANRRQVFSAVLAESALVGVLASLVGVLAGFGVAEGLRRALALVGSELSGSLVLESRTVVVSLIVGLGVTVLSALLPARQATRIAPVAALGQSAIEETRRIGRLRIAIGVLFVVICGGLLMLGAQAGQLVVVAAGGLVGFLAVVLLAPAVVPPLTRLLGWLPARVGGVPGQLARENAKRNPRRTAKTTVALVVGVSLVTLFAVSGASLTASVVDTVDDQLGADLMVVTIDHRQVPAGALDALRGLPEVSLGGNEHEPTLDVKDGVKAADARAAVDRVLEDYPTVQVLDQGQFKEQIVDQVNQLLLFFTALLGLALLVAFVGIANTMSLSVHERTRESATLRALGLTKRGLRSTLSLEAVLMAVVGAVMGMLLGGAVGTAVPYAMAGGEGEGLTPVLAIPWRNLIIYLTIAALAALLSSLVAARRAARRSIVAGLAEE